jgi:hypothetical protein
LEGAKLIKQTAPDYQDVFNGRIHEPVTLIQQSREKKL